jgi:membrane fusion protein, adhesin transport system
MKRKPLHGTAAVSDPQYFALPLELEDGRESAFRRRFLWIGTLGVVFALGWSALTPIRQMAQAYGELIPSGQVRAIQHLEGGIVEEILVRDGQAVEVGDAIVRLAPAHAMSDFSSFSARHSALTQQKLQIEAVLARSGDLLEQPPEVLLNDQRRVFASRVMAEAAQIRALTAQLNQRRAELTSLQDEAKHLSKIVAIQAEQLEMRRKLAETGYSSRKSLLDAEAQLEQARQQLGINLGRQASIKQAISEAEGQVAVREAETRKLLSEEAAKVGAELAEVDEALDKHRDRLTRLVVRAPVQGIVQQVVPRSPGEVIKAGDTVARLVPSSEPIIAQIRLRPSDIAHVSPGDRTELTIVGTDARVDGKLKGRIQSISATTFQPDQAEPFYKATVAFDTDGLPGVRLVPGMLLKANVLTGEQTLLRYLLRPVFDTLDRAMVER